MRWIRVDSHASHPSIIISKSVPRLAFVQLFTPNLIRNVPLGEIVERLQYGCGALRKEKRTKNAHFVYRIVLLLPRFCYVHNNF